MFWEHAVHVKHDSHSFTLKKIVIEKKNVKKKERNAAKKISDKNGDDTE